MIAIVAPLSVAAAWAIRLGQRQNVRTVPNSIADGMRIMETNRSKEPQESAGTDIKPDTDGAKANAPPAGQKPDAAARAGVNPVRRWTFIVLAVCAILLIYHLIADFLTLYTSQAYVQAFVVDIAPEVAGAVVEVNVVDNAEVKVG